MSDPAKTPARLAAEKIAISFASWQRGKLADDIERAILDAEQRGQVARSEAPIRGFDGQRHPQDCTPETCACGCL